MIMKRGNDIGLEWSSESMERLRREENWTQLIKDSTDPFVSYPSYYQMPFHAYPDGNLSLDAALEVNLAATSVHAAVMDPEGKLMERDGDSKLRRSFSTQLIAAMDELRVDHRSIKKVLDLAAATGLSSLELLSAFPGCHVTALDLSPFFIAVGKHLQNKRMSSSSFEEPITFVHGLAEDTNLPSNSQDLVSICLVLHECPKETSRSIFMEAFRVLCPGGVLSIMEMDPQTPAFSRILSNPFAYAAFKSTEPHLVDYISLPLMDALKEAGFNSPLQKQATPRHKCVVAVKP